MSFEYQYSIKGVIAFKRIISTLLILAMVPALIVPALADDFSNDTWFNVLDYCTVNDSGGTLAAVPVNGSISFNTGVTTPIFGLDMVISVSGAGFPRAASVVVGSYREPLQVTHIGGTLYRLFSYDVGGGARPDFQIKFTNSAVMYVNVVSCKIASLSANHFSESGRLLFSPNTASYTTYNCPAGGSVGTSVFGNVNYYVPYSAYVYLDGWQKYDFIDFMMVVNADSIDSIFACFGDIYLPFEVSVFEMTADGTTFQETAYFYSNGIGAFHDGALDNAEWGYADEGELNFDYELNKTSAYVNVRVDLRGLDRSASGDPPYVMFHGQGRLEHDNQLILTKYSGYVVIDQVNPLTKFFGFLTSNLSAWFSDLKISLVNSITTLQSTMNTRFSEIWNTMVNQYNGMTNLIKSIFIKDTTQSGEFDSTVESQGKEIEDANDTLESVTKPAVDDFDFSVDEYMEGQEVPWLNLLGLFFSDVFLEMTLISLLFATAGYILFGKR